VNSGKNARVSGGLKGEIAESSGKGVDPKEKAIGGH